MTKEILGRTMYTVQEMADMLGVQPRTIRQYIRQGRLRAAKFDKRWHVTREEIEGFITGASETRTVRANDVLLPVLANEPQAAKAFNGMSDDMRLLLNAWANMDESERAILEKELEPKGKDK